LEFPEGVLLQAMSGAGEEGAVSMTGTCPVCQATWEWDGRGDPKIYCSKRCAAVAYRRRKEEVRDAAVRRFEEGEISLDELLAAFKR
jgi:endogenous inhibitor of DNA gyrase (YacG/DUF329 family)